MAEDELKVPDFQTPIAPEPTLAKIQNFEEPATLLPKFIPGEVNPVESHNVAHEVSNHLSALLYGGKLSDFQIQYLRRYAYSSIQAMLINQDSWEWQERYEHAVALGELPDPRNE